MNLAYWKFCRRALLLIACNLIICPIGAQKLETGKTTIDIGRTGWKKPVTAVFEFRSKGRHKLRIEKVVPDCYCTVVDYPQGEVGERFEIRMTYDAKMLGHFNKQAAVYTNASKKPVYITMKGQVLEHYVDLTGSYPVVMGDLRLNMDYLEFDDINRGDQRVQQLRIYNNSTQTCQPRLMHLPPYLSAQVVPEVMAPGDEGVITVTLNSTKIHNYGLTQTSVYLGERLGDKVSSDHEIGVSTVLLPSFPDGTDVASAPQLQLSADSVNIVFEGKSKKTEVIDLVNTGKSELKISSLQMFTRGLRISLGKSRLQPGESTKLKITAIREDLQKVRTRPRILMITNDPRRPKITITVNNK
jgi:hypothetical protein